MTSPELPGKSPEKSTSASLFNGVHTSQAEIIDLAGAGFVVFTYEAEKGDYLVSQINLSACSLFQTGNKDVVGESLTSLASPTYREIFSELFRTVLESGDAKPFTIEENLCGSANGQLGGSIFKVSDTAVALVFNATSHAPMVEEAISRGKREWEKTVDALDDIITIMDPDMRIIRANRAAHEMFGYTFGDLVGKKCHETFHDRKTPCHSCPVASTAKDKTIHHDLIYNKKIAKIFNASSSPIYDENGNIKMIVYIARDVTDTIEQEEERKRLSTAIEQTTEVVTITDKEGTIQYVNPAFSKSTGYTKEEAIGKNMSLLKSGKHDEPFYKQLWHTILSGDVWHGQMLNKRKDGMLYYEICTISPVFDADGSISSFVAVKRDISREESLERQLQQAIKLESIGTLAGGIAHDFNNILSAILGYAQIARSQLQENAPALYSINHILSAGDRAADLIKQILTFSRQEQSREPFRALKVQLIVKEALKLLRSSIPATIKLTQKIDNDCSSVMADASQIHQVIMNLCTNALHAIGDSYGEIAITVEELEINSLPKDKPMTILKPGCYLHLQVSDNGCGMDEQLQHRIFDPFFTTKPKDHGTGLGLSVVHGIVNKHNGKITVHSKIGEGTVFDVYLPIIEKSTEEDVKPTEAVRGGTEHILLVDDELQLTEFIKVALERLGYRVTPFTDSLEAVRYFRENSNLFDLVITDMTMPNMTGTELSREMLALRPNLPIILTTGYHESINEEKAKRVGIKKFHHKPLRKADLARSIRELLDNG